MKLINFKTAPFILACSAFLALSGCDGTTGISSDSGFTGVVPAPVPATAPVAVDDTAAGVTATATTISVVANDTDVDNDLDVSSVQIVGNPIVPGEGNWTVDATGSVTFTPETGFTGDPTPISYTVSDDTGLVSNEATVTIDYTQNAPVAVNDNKSIIVTGTESPATSVDVLANDTDAENDINSSSIQIVDPLVVAGEGTWSVTSADKVSFTPEAGFAGDPTPIRYTVSDDTGLVSNAATVTIDYTQTYFENNTTYDIPDTISSGTPGEVVISEINATNAVTGISKVTVTVDITHPWDADLIISLIGPLGDSIILSSDNGADGDDYNNTIFDDAATDPITSGVAPFTGTYSPEESLGIFIDDNATGIWTLEVSDNGNGDVGTLNSWSITIE